VRDGERAAAARGRPEGRRAHDPLDAQRIQIMLEHSPQRTTCRFLEELRATEPAAGSLAVWWIGQSGYILKARTGVLVIDPYLSEHLTAKYAGTTKPHVRMTEAPLRGHELTNVDLITASHKHSDHLDPGTLPDLMNASPGASLVLPAALVDYAKTVSVPEERLVGLEAGQTYRNAGFALRAIPSAHEGLDRDELGRHLYLGFVIEVEGLRLYHSGDCTIFDGLTDWLGPDPFDVMFLPINGRDPARGVAGNMSAAEAVDLAAGIQPTYVVPNHYDMFTFNTVPIETFEAEAARLPAGVTPKVLHCGERWEIKT
jgi:L-ascorbate metabolism protein UlaG (beta-lactamase superfamily)